MKQFVHKLAIYWTWNLLPEHSEADICIANFIHYMPL